jgi:hypothetical protein
MGDRDQAESLFLDLLSGFRASWLRTPFRQRFEGMVLFMLLVKARVGRATGDLLEGLRAYADLSELSY